MHRHIRGPWRRRLAASLPALALVVAGGSAAFAAPPGTAPGATPGAAAAAPPAHQLTPDEALAQARRTHAAVPVTGSTTPTDTLTANPDGTLTRTMAAQPVRKLVHGAWQALDATLHVAADGSVVPAVTTSGLSLSGGGNGPFAAMTNLGRSLA
jgi:hypothetical protein